MNTYLSIDIDYHSGLSDNSPDLYNCWNLVNKALELRVPTVIVDAHHGLVPHANKYGKCNDIRHLINIDFHDDIVVDPIWCGLTEGTWVTYIDWRTRGLYEWRYPSFTHCIQNKEGLCWPNQSIYNKPSIAGWKDYHRQQGIKNIPWSNIKAVGICLSGFWLRQGGIRFYSDYFKFDYASYLEMQKIYGKTLKTLTGMKTFDEALWFAMSSYDYDNWDLNCTHLWSRCLRGDRKNAWTNPKMEFHSPRKRIYNKFNKLIDKMGIYDLEVEL